MNSIKKALSHFFAFSFLLLLPWPAFAQAGLEEPSPAADGASPAGSVQPPPSFEELIPREKLLPLSLQQCLCIALANSLDIDIQKYLPRISAEQIEVQKGAFDPYLFFSALYSDSTIPLPSRVSVATGGLTSVEVEQWTLTGGLAGALPSGLTYQARVASEHTISSTITEFFGTNGQQRFETVLTISQPLLKNFGVDVNTTGIRAAEKAREASMYQLEQSVMETLFEVEQAYWGLVFAYENLEVQLKSLGLATNLLRENQIRLRVGVVAPLAVLQSETGVAFRDEAVILALSRVQAASDALIAQMNLFPGEKSWDLQVFPTEELTIFPPAERVEENEVALALSKRPELKALIAQREIAELEAKFAKNQLLPALNLNASAGLVGLDSDFNSSFFTPTPVPPFPDVGIDEAADDLFSGENFQWLLGFTFEMPLGSHFERGQSRAANLQASQLDTSIQNLRLLIIQDIRDALRQIQTQWERVQASRATAYFSRKSLEAEKKRYDVGATTTFDLLQRENDLAEAEANQLNAEVQYQIALANLRRATGTLLEFLDVTVEVAL